VSVAPSLNEALAVLGAPGFDFAREVVLHEPLPDAAQLVPGKLISLRVIPGGLQIEAESPGTSLLLLPFEFSRSLTWRPEAPELAPVLLARADIAFTALRFHGRIKGTLRFAFGPWTNPGARKDDLTDLRRMGLAEVPLRPLARADRYVDPFTPGPLRLIQP